MWYELRTCPGKRRSVWRCWRTWWGRWWSARLCKAPDQRPTDPGCRWSLGTARRKQWSRGRPPPDWRWTCWWSWCSSVRCDKELQGPESSPRCQAERWEKIPPKSARTPLSTQRSSWRTDSCFSTILVQLVWFAHSSVDARLLEAHSSLRTAPRPQIRVDLATICRMPQRERLPSSDVPKLKMSEQLRRMKKSSTVRHCSIKQEMGFI